MRRLGRAPVETAERLQRLGWRHARQPHLVHVGWVCRAHRRRAAEGLQLRACDLLDGLELLGRAAAAAEQLHGHARLAQQPQPRHQERAARGARGRARLEQRVGARHLRDDELLEPHVGGALRAIELHGGEHEVPRRQSKDGGAVHPCLRLRVAHHHPVEQQLQRVERRVVGCLPRRTDDVPPEAVLVPRAEGRDAQKVELALQIGDLVVQRRARDHPAQAAVQPLTLARELGGAAAHLLHLVEHHALPRHVRQRRDALVQRGVGGDHDVVCRERGGRAPPRAAAVALDQVVTRVLAVGERRAGTDTLGDLGHPLRDERDGHHDEGRTRGEQPIGRGWLRLLEGGDHKADELERLTQTHLVAQEAAMHHRRGLEPHLAQLR